ncbi:FMN-binding negative transcriptional regulator [Metabacillus sp. RGM 3146]|uniref:FMN-binding negative transcriptional regulator n=1 Tax=Metabacillus sp. RGM 3146 TaxID=3401092 RepID=UPI003B9C51FC
MYIPKDFEIEKADVIYEFMEQNGFAALISNFEDEPVATHLPLILDRENGCLYGHFAKANDQWRGILDKTVLALFQGPHSYISPSWYETHKAVPTWNYVSIHVYGKIVLITDPEELKKSLTMLVSKYEDASSPYKMENLPSHYLDGMMKGITGFILKIDRMEGKWKLSQNHSADRQLAVARHLKEIGSENSRAIAELMEKNAKGV